MVPITSFTLTTEDFVSMKIGIRFELNILAANVKVFSDGLFQLEALPKACFFLE